MPGGGVYENEKESLRAVLQTVPQFERNRTLGMLDVQARFRRIQPIWGRSLVVIRTPAASHYGTPRHSAVLPIT